jgi:centromere protein S
MADDDIDELVLAGHGGAIQDPGHEDDPNAARRAALEARLKCEVIRVAEEAAKVGLGCTTS